MKFAASGLSTGATAFSRTFARWFPTPAMIYPRAAGIDISDASIKWLVLMPYQSRYRIEKDGEISL